MRTISFVVPGLPVAQPRPRFARVGNKVHVYTPSKARAWKQLVGLMLKTEGRWDKKPLTGPVRIDASFVMPGKFVARHIKRPDIDNLLKSLLDALTDAGLWKDDSIVYLANVGKWCDTKRHYCEVEIEEMDSE